MRPAKGKAKVKVTSSGKKVSLWSSWESKRAAEPELSQGHLKAIATARDR